jgi:phage gpG-like protein
LKYGAIKTPISLMSKVSSRSKSNALILFSANSSPAFHTHKISQDPGQELPVWGLLHDIAILAA